MKGSFFLIPFTICFLVVKKRIDFCMLILYTKFCWEFISCRSFLVMSLGDLCIKTCKLQRKMLWLVPFLFVFSCSTLVALLLLLRFQVVYWVAMGRVDILVFFLTSVSTFVIKRCWVLSKVFCAANKVIMWLLSFSLFM